MFHQNLRPIKDGLKVIVSALILIFMLACSFSPANELADTLRNLANQVESSDSQEEQQTSNQNVQLGDQGSSQTLEEDEEQEQQAAWSGDEEQSNEHISSSALTEQGSQVEEQIAITGTDEQSIDGNQQVAPVSPQQPAVGSSGQVGPVNPGVQQEFNSAVAAQIYDYDPGETCSQYFGRIVFAKVIYSTDPQIEELQMIDSDGGNMTRIREGIENVHSYDYPAWSPNHCRIAFEGYRQEGSISNSDIYTIRPDGTGIFRLTTHPAIDREPDWSPDGKHIVFVSGRNGESTFHLFVMNADGSGQKLLADQDDTLRNPQWSPDGKRIIFECSKSGLNSEQGQICLVDADGENFLRMTSSDNTAFMLPSWSPDGKQIALATNEFFEHRFIRTAVMDTDNGKIALVDIDIPYLEVKEAHWSSDGKKMLIEADNYSLGNEDYYNQDLVILDLSSSEGYLFITRTRNEEEIHADW